MSTATPDLRTDMPDAHLRAPADADMPALRTGRLIGAGVVAAWLGVIGAAMVMHNQEVNASVAARTLDATTLTTAPPAQFPGGVDKRSLDAANAPPAIGAQPPGPPAGPRPRPHHRGSHPAPARHHQ